MEEDQKQYGTPTVFKEVKPTKYIPTRGLGILRFPPPVIQEEYVSDGGKVPYKQYGSQYGAEFVN